MSEKRFTFKNEDWEINVIDNQNDKWYNLEGNENAKELVDLLNNFYEDNKQLKSLLKDAEDEIETLKESNKLLQRSLVELESDD